MRDLCYENQGNSTYLVYEVKQDDVLDSMSLGMVTNNHIPGLAQTIYTQMDDRRFIKFNVSSKVPVSQTFSGTVRKKFILGVFNGIVDAMTSAEEYMLDPNTIILNLDYIYADVSTCATDLLCLPVTDTQMQPVDLKEFFRNIIFGLNFDSSEDCDYIPKLINFLNGKALFSLTEFKKLLDEIAGAKAQPVVKPGPIQPKLPKQSPKQPVVQPVVQPMVQPAVKPQVPKQPSGMPPIPGKPAIPHKGPAPAVKNTPKEKEISLFYLLQHYNKDNAAAYKAQKKNKKQGGNPPRQEKPPKKNQNPAVNYAIPGRNMPLNRAVPPAPAYDVPKQFPSNTSSSGASQLPQMPQIPDQPGHARNFGETTVLGGPSAGETTVLCAAPEVQKNLPFVIRRKNNEKFVLDQPVYRVGKERSYANYYIGDNPAISRSHANFLIREDAVYVVDTNSTNHTFVNGQMIQSGEEVRLNHGDVIRLANEDFEFYLY